MPTPAGWQNICLIGGSSAGALIGLQFVVMTLSSDMPRRTRRRPGGQRLFDSDHCSFRRWAAAVGDTERSGARRNRPFRFVGIAGAGRHHLRRHRGVAHAGTVPIPAPPGAPKRPMRVEHEYVRWGAWAYFAAPDVPRGRVFGRCETTAGIAPFDRLVEPVMTRPPYNDAKPVFWIVDNGSSQWPSPSNGSSPKLTSPRFSPSSQPTKRWLPENAENTLENF
jgi:hypothetical protein